MYHRCVCEKLIINKCNNKKLAINYKLNFFRDILAKEISILDLSKNSFGTPCVVSALISGVC